MGGDRAIYREAKRAVSFFPLECDALRVTPRKEKGIPSSWLAIEHDERDSRSQQTDEGAYQDPILGPGGHAPELLSQLAVRQPGCLANVHVAQVLVAVPGGADDLDQLFAEILGVLGRRLMQVRVDVHGFSWVPW